MDRFQLRIDVEPKDIPNLDDAHKRDCADSITGEVNRAFKNTLIFSAAVLAFYGLYSIFSVIYLMRMHKMLPQITFILPLTAAAVFLVELVAGTMQKWALIAEIILYLLIILTVIAFNEAVVQSLWIIPFACFGIYAHIKLIYLLPYYRVISKQEGFPEFTPLPSREEIVPAKKSVSAEASPETNEAEGSEDADDEDGKTSVNNGTAAPEKLENAEVSKEKTTSADRKKSRRKKRK